MDTDSRNGTGAVVASDAQVTFVAEDSPLAAEILAQLDVLDPARVATRQGPGGRVFSYLEGAEVIDTANKIFGRGSWGYELVAMVQEGTTYTAHVRLTVRGCVPFADIGVGVAACKAGEQPSPDAVETAKKGAVTDAVKRCLKNFGAAFGLTLYFKDASGANGNGNGNGSNHAASAVPATGSAPTVSADGTPKCPKCSGAMWDNRESKRNPKAPDYKCRDKNCDGAIWPPKQPTSSPF